MKEIVKIKLNNIDWFEIVDCITEEDKKDDKICYPIYKKVSELFSSIEEAMKLQLSNKEKEEKKRKNEIL